MLPDTHDVLYSGQVHRSRVNCRSRTSALPIPKWPWKGAKGSVPPQLRKSEVELKDLIPAARGLAKGLRQSIHRIRKLRLAATHAESRLSPQNARRQAPLVAKRPPLRGDVLRTKAGKATVAACKLLGDLLDVKSRIGLSLLRSDDRDGPLREALEKLTFAKGGPASNRWPAVSSFDEESVLHALDRFEMLLDAVPLSDREGPNKIELSGTLKNGQFCDRVEEFWNGSVVRVIVPSHPIGAPRPKLKMQAFFPGQLRPDPNREG